LIEAATGQPGEPGISPYDTYSSAGLRFVVELIAWIAGPWAVAEISGTAWAAVPAALVLLTLPSVFSTPGDKNKIVVATPGPLRVLIEVVLWAVAVAGAWIAWPAWLAVVMTLVVAAAVATGLRRMLWLMSGAPPVDQGADEAG
jgi:hypothetical protein